MKKRRIMLTAVLLFFTAVAVWAGGGQQAAPASATPSAAPTKTLRIIGNNAFSSTGPDGTIDAITGLELPGYQMIIDEWKRLHPDVDVVIEANPFDGWQASLQTGVLAGGVDVLLHGATMTALNIPLDDRIAADTEWASKRLAYSVRRSEELGSLENFYVTGIPVTVNAMVVLINKEILAHYNVALPSEDWTWDDLLAIAKACTGTDPVTNQPTYGIQVAHPESTNDLWKNFANVGYGLGSNPTITYGSTAKTSKLVYNDASAMKAWNYLGELVKYTSPADREGLDVSNPATSLNIAIYFTENPVSTYRYLNTMGVADKYFAQNLPIVNSGELAGEVTPFFGDSNMSICKTSTQQDLAWEWIKFCTTNPVPLQYFIDTGGVVNNSDYFGRLNTLMPQEWVNVFDRSFNKLPPTYSPSTGMYTNNVSFGSMGGAIGQAIRMMMMGNMNPLQAAASVQTTADEFMASLQ